eukprot:2146512-Rhodomonas_salina.1
MQGIRSNKLGLLPIAMADQTGGKAGGGQGHLQFVHHVCLLDVIGHLHAVVIVRKPALREHVDLCAAPAL